MANPKANYLPVAAAAGLHVERPERSGVRSARSAGRSVRSAIIIIVIIIVIVSVIRPC